LGRLSSMQRPNFFLRTKLLAPRAVSELLERPRLTSRLQANLSAPMTLVAADAGCGKTTLIADFVRNQQRPSVWYQLDHTDADPIVFLTYVASGIRNLEPRFGDALFAYLEEAGEELIRFPERGADLLINEILESVEQPFILVLDDYHHIGRDTIVHRIVDRLVQYSSDLLHVIITTRDLPPLALMRRRTQAAALVIDREDLLFTDVEVRELFRRTLNVELNDDEIAEYRGRTHGWITALQLIRQVAEQARHGEAGSNGYDLRGILQRSERDIFDYFAEEVFAREPEDIRNLMMNLSLLESMQLDICSSLFPDLRCSAVLPELEQKNVFVTAAGEGKTIEEYRFHPLFREFLRRRLRSEIGQARVSAERVRIAEFFLAAGQWEIGASYLLDAQEYDRLAELVASRGDEWMRSGAFTFVGMVTEQVPVGSLERFPRGLVFKAEFARQQGDLDRASGLLQRSVHLLREAGDAAGEAEALHALASLARRRGHTAEAFELLGQAEKLVAQDSETYLKCANTRGLSLIAVGDWTDAEKYFRVAFDIAQRQANEHYVRLVTHNLALVPGLRGDFGEALKWFSRIFRDDQPNKQLPQEAIGHLNVARLHIYRGEFDEAESHLRQALDLCQLYNLRSLRGEIFEAYGNFYREKNDLAHAEEFYERALAAYVDAEIDPLSKELNEERASFCRRRGELAKARSLIEKLIAYRSSHDNEIGIRTARLRLCEVLLDDGKTEGLFQQVDELRRFFQIKNHYYDEAAASILLAEIAWRARDEKAAVEPLMRVIDLAARFDYDHWIRMQIARVPQLFAIEDVFEKLPPDLRAAVEAAARRGAAVISPQPAAISDEASVVTDLEIGVLGPVVISRDPTSPFAPDAWTTRRARDMFCYIATSPHRRVAKDVLIEAFWPNEDPATVEKNFHPTISHIRKALNSRQSLKQNFLVFRDGAYQLNPELNYSIDTEGFENLILQAEAAKREKDPGRLRESLEAALTLYRGEYMPGVYDDWAEERRQYYSEQLCRVLNALAKLSFTEKRWAAAIKFAGELLRQDPYREDVHRLIMKVHAAQGKPASVKKHFEDLRQLLQKDLGIEPAAETRRIFEELVK
jgi:LuxR family transcriptional regulator, maltose regulon positive regulatory protein